MALSTTDVEQVLTEIAPAIQGGWIQKVYQPSSLTLVLEIRAPGRTHRVLICCEPDRARLHMINLPLSNPPSPPAFCQFLRAHLHRARITALSHRLHDRIVEWQLATKEGPRKLVCALTGKTANVFLLDAAGLVLKSLRGDREFRGRPYLPPAPRESPKAASSGARSFEPAVIGDFPLSAAIDTYYHEREAVDSAHETRVLRLRTLKKAIKKDARRIDAWRGDLAKAEMYRHYARYGELLKANLPSITKGQERVTLVDYFDEAMPEVTLPLDADKSPQGNMETYFRKHRKLVIAEQALRPRIEEAERDLAQLQQELRAIEMGTWTPPPRGPAQHARVHDPREFRQERRGPFRRFLSTDGLPIFVGRNARENDALTFGLAKSDDLWLHAQGVPGSHVIVRLERGKEPPLETLKEAATLAVLYSDLKKSGKGEVIYTKRKWVKKAKGQAPGAVVVTQERSLHIVLDQARLTALRERTKEST